MLEFTIIRDRFAKEQMGREGFSLGKIYCENVYYGETVEDEDRYLEVGGTKVHGKTAMPVGRFAVELYHSPKHGEVPLFLNVPQFTYTEIHKANKAEELLGCVGVGRVRTLDGVANCADVLKRIVSRMQVAEDMGQPIFCTIKRDGE